MLFSWGSKFCEKDTIYTWDNASMLWEILFRNASLFWENIFINIKWFKIAI